MAPRKRQCLKGDSRERVLRQAKNRETEFSSQGGRVSRHTDTHVLCVKNCPHLQLLKFKL